MPLSPLEGVLGGVPAGIQGFEQSQLFKADLTKEQALTTEETQKASSGPMLAMWQAWKQHPELGNNAAFVQNWNKYSSSYGLNVDPHVGIPSWLKDIDPMQIVNPTAYMQRMTTMNDNFNNNLRAMMVNPQTTPASLMSYIRAAAADPNTKDSAIAAIGSNPQLMSDLAKTHESKMGTEITKAFENSAQGQHYIDMISNADALLQPRIQHLLAENRGIQSQIDYRSKASQALLSRAETDRNFKYGFLASVFQKNADQSIHWDNQDRNEWVRDAQNASKLYRQTAQSLIADESTAESQGISIPGFNMDADDPKSVVGQITRYNQQASDLDSMVQLVQSGKLQPYQPTGIPTNTHITDRYPKAPAHVKPVTYHADTQLYLIGGKNAATSGQPQRVVYKGNLGYINPKTGQIVKLGKYNKDASDQFSNSAP